MEQQLAAGLSKGKIAKVDRSAWFSNRW
jgi:hypothetical protein